MLFTMASTNKAQYLEGEGGEEARARKVEMNK